LQWVGLHEPTIQNDLAAALSVCYALRPRFVAEGEVEMLRFLLVVMTGSVLAAAVQAQGPAVKFKWQKGQILVYRVEHTTIVVDSVGESKNEVKSKLNLTKRWQVVDVDSAGVGTLQLSLTALRNETTAPDGTAMIFDSADPDKNADEASKAMAAFVNRPLATIRVDGCGRVVEVKESKQGGMNRFEALPPFNVIVPAQPVKDGQFWDRNYNITLDPPQGTGEKVPATQRYTCRQNTSHGVVIQVVTTLKKEPEAPADRIPLLQWLPEGEVEFDPQSGILRSAKLKIDKEVKGHQGDDSTYRFQSNYVEEYVGAK
jgi:hypothetical protein